MPCNREVTKGLRALAGNPLGLSQAFMDSDEARRILMKELVERLWYEEEGLNLSEYALLLLLFSLVVAVAFVRVGASTGNAHSGAPMVASS